MYNINDIVTKKSGKPFKGGNKIDMIEKLLINPNSPTNQPGAYLKYSKTIVSLNMLTVVTPASDSNDYIYLISDDGHRDSIDLDKFFINDDAIQKYVEEYYKEFFNLEITGFIIDYENELISFYAKDFDDLNDTWDKCSMHLHKIKKFNV